MEIQNWIADVNQKAEIVGNVSALAGKWKKVSIYKVPCCIRGGNEEKQRAYMPQLVSIGPYHHGEDHLKPMEEHKQQALVHFLKRSNKPLEAFVNPVAQVVEDLIDSYGDLDLSWKNDTNKFLQLMIVDGVFMLEVFCSTVRELNYPDDDPIFSHNRNRPLLSIIRRDFLMLENQLPMAVLGKLVAVQSNNSEGEEFVIKSLVSPFFFPSPTRSDLNLRECMHVLDVCRKILVFKGQDGNEGHPQSIRIPIDKAQNNETLPPAMVLKEMEIRLEASETRSLEGASFKGRMISGLLKLPRIIVDQDSETLFHNLLALERLHIKAGNEVTSYLAFMNNIIRDVEDVSVLTSYGIIIKGNNVYDQTVFEFLQSLPKDIIIDPESNLAMVSKKLSRHCYRSPWFVNQVALMLLPEFNTPIKRLTFYIACIALPLTLVQTIYAILSYKKP
ncbi:hypothetical protein V6N11_082017 [Hibiscus sabdariffa]|uniref:Uncharacterized protein n=2 Tax=Hibiscus sabdariffa TaxID=183260 RepID=A0ABR2CW31_9ROSI